MNDGTVASIVKRFFDIKSCLYGLAAGSLIGAASWAWGASPWPTVALSLVSGFGWSFTACVLAAVLLYSLGHMPGKLGRLACGDFENLFAWVHSKSFRAMSVLLGVACMAGVSWAITGSASAAIVCMIGALFSAVCAWYWVCLAVMSDEQASRVG